MVEAVRRPGAGRPGRAGARSRTRTSPPPSPPTRRRGRWWREQRAALFPQVDARRRRATAAAAAAARPPRAATRSSIGGSWEPDVWGRLRARRRRRAGRRAGQRRPTWRRRACRRRASWPPTTSTCARPTCRARCWRTRIDRLPAQPADHPEPLRRRHRGAAPTCCRPQTPAANAQADLLGAGAPARAARACDRGAGRQGAGQLQPAARPTGQATVPDVPSGVPSTLLQRRPDIAAAERRVGAGQRADRHRAPAYFPSFGLTGSLGTGASQHRRPVQASACAWSLGAVAGADDLRCRRHAAPASTAPAPATRQRRRATARPC